jgi:hypothetical protein
VCLFAPQRGMKEFEFILGSKVFIPGIFLVNIIE